ncbi:PfkB domain protein [Caldithrix abyssi DSM 13497]|uniref:PfkB domain protein n=1 Tax=Caldithrix abyssi DSM 13497 TaxID=880073 RepID=H1XSE4_CALAY|nr:PfkB family carbohydrate kinase [Caldithrix abyssi]APF17221.1 Sugar or nucleoside kinase, ribokinase family [Caldithrix abyssi DSM 13497]EHO41356.1 PfkB domain protein [Caldithrix abyssi DSM 13497]
MSLLVVGSIAYDTIETPTARVEDSLGGSALYFSAAASLFTPVNVVGVVGSDFDASKISFLKKRGVNFDGLYMESGKTFRWGGRYFDDMNKRETLFTYLNVFERFQPVIPEHYQKAEFVFLANIDPELQLEVLKQIENPKLIVLDTMNFWISGKRKKLEEVLAYTDIIVLNDEEVREITGENGLIKAARAIPQMGPKSVIVKKGEHGAMLYHEEEFFFVPAFPLENVVDPTGAGDSFAGGFMGFLAKAQTLDLPTLKKAIVYGSTIASFNVEDFSFKRLEKIKMKEIKERVKLFKKMTAF